MVETVKYLPSAIPADRARNIAARRCGVEFISFIDADDLMLPYNLQRITHLMRTTNATVGYHNYFQKKASGVIVRTRAELERRIVHDRANDLISSQRFLNLISNRVLIATLVALRQRTQRQMQKRVAACLLCRRTVEPFRHRERSWHTKKAPPSHKVDR